MAIAEQSAIDARIAGERTLDAASPSWTLSTRIAFRFCVMYLGIYVILTQMLTCLLFVTTNDSGAFEVDMTRPAKAIVVWLAAHVFRIGHSIVTVETGSGDRIYDWIVLVVTLGAAILGTVIWSILDRRRESYPELQSWFRVFIRFSLAATMLTYGAFKVIPLQMPFPGLNTLLEPYGHFSPMGVLWSSIGAAPAYEIFAGCAEFFGGLLLLSSRTATLGALVCLADVIQVFTLNMTYDVTVKLLSFHLILFSLFLLAPEAKRLANVFLLNRPAPPFTEPPLFSSVRANRIALAVQILFAIYLVVGNIYGSISEYNVYGPGAPKSPLYGIWDVQNFTLDGQSLPPLTTDAQRWRRLIFDSPGYVTVQGMNDTFRFYAVTFAANAPTFSLATNGAKSPDVNLSFSRPASGELVLDGVLSGHKLHAQLSAYDLSKFRLVRRGFHWISE